MTQENTEIGNSVFTELRSSTTRKKKKGLKKPPEQGGVTRTVKENAPAVPVDRSKARTYRINTNISEEVGGELEDAIKAIRQTTGKKPKIAEVLEMGIKAINKKYGNT